jgi:hypothetical protein
LPRAHVDSRSTAAHQLGGPQRGENDELKRADTRRTLNHRHLSGNVVADANTGDPFEPHTLAFSHHRRRCAPSQSVCDGITFHMSPHFVQRE